MSAGGSGNSAVAYWESSPSLGGPYTQIPDPNGREATYSTGRADYTTQPKATAIVDAQASDVFVRVSMVPTINSTLLAASSFATITTFGTSAVANSPLTTKGDLFTHDTGEQRLPVGIDTQVLVADSAESTGLKYANTASANIPDFSSSKTYKIGDLVIHSNKIYHNIIAITAPGSFNGTEWKIITIVEEIGRVELLSPSNTMDLVVIGNFRNIRIVYRINPTDTFLAQCQFNEDTGTNYSEIWSDSFGTVDSTINDDDIIVGPSGGSSTPIYGVMTIYSDENEERIGSVVATGQGGMGEGVTPEPFNLSFKWDETLTPLTSINFIVTFPTGGAQYGSGSYAIAYGWD